MTDIVDMINAKRGIRKSHIGKSDSIYDWYAEKYADSYEHFNDFATFSGLYNSVKEHGLDGVDISDYIGNSETQVRERVFDRLEELHPDIHDYVSTSKTDSVMDILDRCYNIEFDDINILRMAHYGINNLKVLYEVSSSKVWNGRTGQYDDTPRTLYYVGIVNTFTSGLRGLNNPYFADKFESLSNAEQAYNSMSIRKSVDTPGFYTRNGEVPVGSTVDEVMQYVRNAGRLYVRPWNGSYEGRIETSEDEFRHYVELALANEYDSEGRRYALYGFFADDGDWVSEILYQN